jgi:hypothetical protein
MRLRLLSEVSQVNLTYKRVTSDAHVWRPLMGLAALCPAGLWCLSTCTMGPPNIFALARMRGRAPGRAAVSRRTGDLSPAEAGDREE